ncbi:4ad3e661-774b-4424-87c2-be1b9fe8c2ae [Thermothielavioides terrestris]|uniref:4ad3e661-774b-4424-87c2-be1b9fe8c2ae n=1 Tax=Thermothielavioides terrestris TaxID=2587410 RepID=A0A3S4B3H4_9PEZI|nr:4ad3e661-774b-4424-87c2-be1b9fe8c2ae [Thermothielavioides terrestris]
MCNYKQKSNSVSITFNSIICLCFFLFNYNRFKFHRFILFNSIYRCCINPIFIYSNANQY